MAFDDQCIVVSNAGSKLVNGLYKRTAKIVKGYPVYRHTKKNNTSQIFYHDD